MIQAKAMLADLSISIWTAQKHDKKVSAEVEKSHGAHDAGRFNKALIDKAHLEPLMKLAGELRTYHYQRTLPWTDKGQRLLPSMLFMEYSAEIRKFKAEFSKRVQDFLAIYPRLVQDASVRLNTMFKPDDYPKAYEIADKFSIDIEFMPVPAAHDFRVDLAEDAKDEIQKSITQAVSQRQAKAVKDCYSRVQEVVKRISETCSKEKPRIYDTLIENARDLVGVLSGLNITNDPDITRLEQEVAAMLVDPQTLRDSPDARKKIADAADAILANMPFAAENA
ncbi:hypothetical protein QTI66_32695 [Variovorax sp. J22R133]|uniref:hypothetical protein n=1 Tax=Variovorax brevis TaxID=3053503 RepID=UPI002577E5C9|nr:hypothetical protein [Variovorax sp. J22R133]MDM0116887.1 hypothetical protein [Variovorax sp. J22R133]